MGFIKFAIKSSLAGGFIYYTIEEGLWSSSDESIKFYRKLYNNIAPYIQNNIPKDVVKEIPDLPSVSTMTNCARGMWNNGVKTSIKYTSELPTHVSNGVDKLMSSTAVKDSIENFKISNQQPPSKPQ